MSWGEGLRLSRTLALDMSSWVAASINGWVEPVSREYLAVKTLVDNYVLSKTEKRPRLSMLRDPFAPPPKRLGTASLTIPQLRALLERNRAEEAV